MVGLNRRSKSSAATALSKYLRKAGVGVSYYGSTFNWENGGITVDGDGVFCIGASIRYRAPVGYRHQGDKGLEEAEWHRGILCEVLEESGRYGYKVGDLDWIEGVGYTFTIHVEHVNQIRGAESARDTCFPHLR